MNGTLLRFGRRIAPQLITLAVVVAMIGIVFPGFFDISIAKKFAIRESQWIEFRAEFFNFPNHINFVAPGSGGFVVNTAAYGVLSSTTPSRQIQFALRYRF